MTVIFGCFGVRNSRWGSDDIVKLVMALMGVLLVDGGFRFESRRGRLSAIDMATAVIVVVRGEHRSWLHSRPGDSLKSAYAWKGSARQPKIGSWPTRFVFGRWIDSPGPKKGNEWPVN